MKERYLDSLKTERYTCREYALIEKYYIVFNAFYAFEKGG